MAGMVPSFSPSTSPSATSSMAGAEAGGGGGAAGNGGSGIVIIRYSSLYVATLSAGLTYTSTPVGTDTVIRVTAGTGTVTFA